MNGSGIGEPLGDGTTDGTVACRGGIYRAGITGLSSAS